MSMISCRDVSLGYDGHAIVGNLNFLVEQGNYLCIVGENGSGKSTLIKTLLRLNKPLKGAIEFGDGLLPTEIGYLPQQTAAQRDFPASVREIVLSGCLNSMGKNPFWGNKLKVLAQSNMEKMGICQLADRCYRELSGGQQQRVLLARALCATKKLLLLDEPVAGLDPVVTAEMYQTIEKLNRNDGITVIMISHDISAALKYASHILHLARNPLFFGEKQAYLQSDANKNFSQVSEND